MFIFLFFRKFGVIFFMFVENTNELEEPVSIPLMKQEIQESCIWQSHQKL